MGSPETPPRNRAERRLASTRGQADTRRGSRPHRRQRRAGDGRRMGRSGDRRHPARPPVARHVHRRRRCGHAPRPIAAASPGDTIDFSVTGTITLTTGQIAFAKDLTISGPGAAALTVSGNDASRIFNITGASAVTISGLTLAHGSSDDSGAIDTDGALTLESDVFDHNVSSDDGGAVNADGGAVSVARLHVHRQLRRRLGRRDPGHRRQRAGHRDRVVLRRQQCQ